MKLLSNIVIVLLALSASTDAKPASPEVKPHGDPPAGGFSSKDAKPLDPSKTIVAETAPAVQSKINHHVAAPARSASRLPTADWSVKPKARRSPSPRRARPPALACPRPREVPPRLPLVQLRSAPALPGGRCRSRRVARSHRAALAAARR